MKNFSHETPCAVKAACTVWAGAKGLQGPDLSALFISALFYPALTMLFLYRNTLLGLGNGVTPMLAGVCELLSRMIGAPVLGHFFGFTGLCWINPIAWVTASGLLFLSYRKTMRNIRPVDPTVDASDSNKIMN